MRFCFVCGAALDMRNDIACRPHYLYAGEGLKPTIISIDTAHITCAQAHEKAGDYDGLLMPEAWVYTLSSPKYAARRADDNVYAMRNQFTDDVAYWLHPILLFLAMLPNSGAARAAAQVLANAEHRLDYDVDFADTYELDPDDDREHVEFEYQQERMS